VGAVVGVGPDEFDDGRRAAEVGVLDVDVAAVLGDERVDRVEADPGAVAVETLLAAPEHRLAAVGVDPRAVVGDAHADGVVYDLGGDHREFEGDPGPEDGECGVSCQLVRLVSDSPGTTR
jgi:hypothetical protein